MLYLRRVLFYLQDLGPQNSTANICCFSFLSDLFSDLTVILKIKCTNALLLLRVGHIPKQASSGRKKKLNCF